MRNTLIPSLIVLVVMAAAAVGQNSKTVEVPFFGNENCPITGKAVDRTLNVSHEGQRIYACCKRCVGKIKADLPGSLAKAYPAKSVVDVKNANCPIMGGKAKSKVFAIFQGHKVHFCCPGCDGKFKKEPRKHLALLTQKGLTDLGNKKCPVINSEGVGADSFAIYKNKIVNLCCDDCVAKFKKSPEKYLKTMAATEKKDGHGKKGHGDHDHQR